MGNLIKLLLVLLMACPTSVSITPASPTVANEATQQFTAVVEGTSNQAVAWTATCGAISSSGLYTAPATVTGTCTVTATSQVDTTKSAAATVTVTLPPLSISCDPSHITGLRAGDNYVMNITSQGRTASVSCVK